MNGVVQLIVGLSSSKCGACGRNADPNEAAHDMVSMRGEGCGAVFTEVTTYYADAEEATSALCPDLPFFNSLGPTS